MSHQRVTSVDIMTVTEWTPHYSCSLLRLAVVQPHTCCGGEIPIGFKCEAEILLARALTGVTSSEDTTKLVTGFQVPIEATWMNYGQAHVASGNLRVAD